MSHPAWPAVHLGHAKAIGPYARCEACGTGTWVAYGGSPCCWHCATGTPRPPEPPAPPDPVEVDFTAEELARIRVVARARGRVKRDVGVRDEKVDARRSDAEVDEVGLRAYCAVAKLLGVAPLLDVSRRGRPPGYVVAAGGWTVLVRSSVHRHGHLIFRDLGKLAGDAVVFAVPALLSEGISLVGWTTPAEFRAQAGKQDFGYGEEHRVSQRALRPLGALVAAVRGEGAPPPF